MRNLYIASCLPLLFGCAADTPRQQATASASLTKTLVSVECGDGYFRGQGIEASEQEAINTARAAIAQQIQSSIKVSQTHTQNQSVVNGKENLSSGFAAKTVIETALSNAHDMRVMRIEREAKEVGAVVCMSKADAAKPYIIKQAELQDSLELLWISVQKATQPRQKSETRGKAGETWAKILTNNDLLKGWNIENDISRARDLHDAIEDDYKEYCQNAKLHWSPERETPYSEIVFSKLSGNIKMEKSPCAGRGISLAYKNSEPECLVKFGLNSCSFAQSISVKSCDGTEYLQLKNDVMGAHQKQNFALEKLQNNLKSAEFWNQWIQEIKQWSPLCP